RRRHTRFSRDWSSDVCSSDLHIWINISDLQEKIVSDSANKITDKAIEDYNPSIVPKGSLLYSFKLSVGKVAFNERDCYTNEAIRSEERRVGKESRATIAAD